MKPWVVLLLFLIACAAPVPPAPVPEKIVEKVVVQCWDGSTAESVEKCPPEPEEKPVEEVKPEVKPEPAPTAPPEVNIAQKLLETVRSKFAVMAYLLEDQMVMQKGGKIRHYFFKLSELEDRTPITDVYVDLDAKTAVAYCSLEREGRMQGDGYDYERSKCKNYLDKPIPTLFEKWVPKGPIEWLEEFAPLKPILVEDNVQTISIGGNSKSIQPSLHYMVDGKRVILRIDKRYGVPIRIEREGQQSIDFRDTYFDVMVIEGKQFKIDETWMEYQPVSEYWKKGNTK